MERLPDAFDLMSWVAENRDRLKPPTAADTGLRNDKFMLTIVGGPNFRTDYHVNQGLNSSISWKVR